MSCNSCKDLGNNCADITSSTCVSWQGDKVEDLSICIGDSLTYVGNIVLSKIKDILKGKGIILEDLTLSDCDYINDLLGTQEKNLLNVLDSYKKAICKLDESHKATLDEIKEFADISAYTLGCLPSKDPCGANYTLKTLIQAIIDKVCSISGVVTNVAASLLAIVEEGAGNFLVGGAVRSSGSNGISYSGNGKDAKVIIEALVPPNCPVVYTGSTSMFDSKGIGLPNTPYAGWYLCNGANGTPNSSTLPQNAGGTVQYIIRFK